MLGSFWDWPIEASQIHDVPEYFNHNIVEDTFSLPIIKNRDSNIYVYISVHSNIIHNSHKVEGAQFATNGCDG